MDTVKYRQLVIFGELLYRKNKKKKKKKKKPPNFFKKAYNIMVQYPTDPKVIPSFVGSALGFFYSRDGHDGKIIYNNCSICRIFITGYFSCKYIRSDPFPK